MTFGVRSRITILATVVVLLVLSLTGIALVASQRTVLTDNVDEVLQRHSEEVEFAIVAGGPIGVLPGQGDDEAFARVLDREGRLIASTAQLAAAVVVPPVPEGGAQFATIAPTGGGSEFRVMSRTHDGLVIITGTPLDDVNDSVNALTRALAIAVPAASLLLAIAIWLLVGRVLRPVERMRREVAEISGSNLHRRVPEPGTRDEIARLAHTMNEMLERVEDSAERQRRFVADASHELRSPLTRIRAELEVDLAHPDSADLAATHRSVLDEASILQRLVEDLLLLARSDGTGLPGRREPVDLDDVVLAEVARFSGTAGKVVDISRVSAARVVGDAGQLARIIRNVLDNAVHHGGQQIAVSLREEGGGAMLSIADDGPGIPVELRERVFERFARIDEARSADGGTGLGLAITRELVSAHGGTIVVDPEYAPGTRLVIRLPSATA